MSRRPGYAAAFVLAAQTGCHPCKESPHSVRQRGPSLEVNFPSTGERQVIVASLSPGNQVETHSSRCGPKAITLAAWKSALQAEGFEVQLGSWDTIDRWGLRFDRHDGLLGDLYSDLSADKGQVCSNIILRVQRRSPDGTARAWFTSFGIHSDADPAFYFPNDPRFPAGY